ncbi:MAG: NAD(P)H-dependent oxidoreductase [Marinilabiliaceae bacterium]
MEYLHRFQWRYATKSFDKTRKPGPEQLNRLLQAADLAPSSYGLQPFSLILVEDEKMKEKLSPAAYHQPQVTEAPYLFVFAAKTDLSEKDVDEFVERIVKTWGVERPEIADYENAMKGSVNKRTPESRFNWAARQAYISLGFLLSAAAIEGLDACPMEGFSNEQFDKILGLKEKGLSSLAMMALGYRSPDDEFQHYKKVRKSLDEFVIRY